MSASNDPTYLDLLAPGEAGDAPLTLRLTLRQAAAFELVTSLGISLGACHLALVATQGHGVSVNFALAFEEAQYRLGFGLAQALGNAEHVEAFAARLAELDQQKAARNGD